MSCVCESGVNHHMDSDAVNDNPWQETASVPEVLEAGQEGGSEGVEAVEGAEEEKVEVMAENDGEVDEPEVSNNVESGVSLAPSSEHQDMPATPELSVSPPANATPADDTPADDTASISSDSSFGSFDEAEAEPPAAPTSAPAPAPSTSLPVLLETLFPAEPPTVPSDQLLDARSQELLSQLTHPRRLVPLDWKRLALRHRLLVSLLVPVNLDEVSSDRAVASGLFQYQQLDASSYEPPAIDAFQMLQQDKDHVRENTTLWVEAAEAALQQQRTYWETLSDEELEKVVTALRAHKLQLEKANAVWQEQLQQLQQDHDTYELVVENFVGHAQRMSREEMKEDKKKKRAFWKKK